MKNKHILPIYLFVSFLSLTGCSLRQETHTGPSKDDTKPATYTFDKEAVLSFSFDETDGSYTRENVSEEKYRIDYVFSSENASILFKKPNDPLLKEKDKTASLSKV